MRFLFNLQIDCEATQHAIHNAELGERAIRGLADILSKTGSKATFVVIPSDMKVHSHLYQELEAQGQEIGLHLHPADQGYNEFMGVYGFDEQMKMLKEAMEIFSEFMGRMPECFTPGYCSANDDTYPALESVGLKHGTVSLPTRDLPQCASVWGRSPLDAHYPHRYHRCLSGDIDFVDVPSTLDPESRMWGGSHPQDLRIELVDAKNHWYTIHKSVMRQIEAGDRIPVKYLKAVTHNVFDYSDSHNFRRETLLGVIEAAREICKRQQCELIPATTGNIAAEYRSKVPLAKSGITLELDTRGRCDWAKDRGR